MAEEPEGHRPAPRAPRAAAARAARPAIERDPHRRLLGKADTADALDGGHLAARQQHDPGRGAHGRAGRIALVLAAASLTRAPARRSCSRCRSSSAFDCAMVKTTNFASGVICGLMPRALLILSARTAGLRTISSPSTPCAVCPHMRARRRRATASFPGSSSTRRRRHKSAAVPCSACPRMSTERIERTATNAAPHKSERRCNRWRVHHHTSRITKTCKSAGRERSLPWLPPSGGSHRAADAGYYGASRAGCIAPFLLRARIPATVLSVWNCQRAAIIPPPTREKGEGRRENPVAGSPFCLLPSPLAR